MKAKAADIAAYVKKLPDHIRVVVIFGRDEGLVRERCALIGKQIAPDLSDPFQVARPSIEDVKNTPSILLDEISAISMMGGRRLVRLEGAGNESTEAVKLVLAGSQGDGLLVISAGDLTPSSSLRKLAEKEKAAVAMACYVDNARDLIGLIQTTMQQAGLTIDQDASGFLRENLGGDRMVSRSELDKLILYKVGDENKKVTLEDAKACVGDTSALGLNQIAEAITAGRMVDLEKLLERAWTARESAVAILRVLTGRLMRMHLARGYMDTGMNAANAVSKLRPPVFFAEKDKFTAEISRWNSLKLGRALEICMTAELDCKTTGNPADVICARALLSIAKAAR